MGDITNRVLTQRRLTNPRGENPLKMEFFEHWGEYWKKGINELSFEEAKHFHEKEKPYVAVLSDEKPRFIVNMYFNYKGYFCSLQYLNDDLEIERTEAYIFHQGRLFLKNTKKWYYDERETRNGKEVTLVTYVYETDGRYRKNYFSHGEDFEEEYGTCDVSSHFREMIQFGNYDSILPEEAKRGLREEKEEDPKPDTQSDT